MVRLCRLLPPLSPVPQEGVRTDLRGSAVCTSLLSVLAYEDETLSSFTQSAVDRNDCPLDAKQGYADMAGVLLLFLLLLLLGKAQEKATQYTDTQVSSLLSYIHRLFKLCDAHSQAKEGGTG